MAILFEDVYQFHANARLRFEKKYIIFYTSQMSASTIFIEQQNGLIVVIVS